MTMHIQITYIYYLHRIIHHDDQLKLIIKNTNIYIIKPYSKYFLKFQYEHQYTHHVSFLVCTGFHTMKKNSNINKQKLQIWRKLKQCPAQLSKLQQVHAYTHYRYYIRVTGFPTIAQFSNLKSYYNMHMQHTHELSD